MPIWPTTKATILSTVAGSMELTCGSACFHINYGSACLHTHTAATHLSPEKVKPHDNNDMVQLNHSLEPFILCVRA
jgi:hypothetical protein